MVLHAVVATRRPGSLNTLETLSRVGAGSRRLAARWRAVGYSTLEELEAHYPGGGQSLARLLRAEVSPTLGRAVQNWR